MLSHNRIGVGSRVTIQYTNGQGSTSRRMIDVREVTFASGYTYIRAWCHTRGEERTFRTDRMEVLRSHPAQDTPEGQGAAAERAPAERGHPAAAPATPEPSTRPATTAPSRDGAQTHRAAAPSRDGARPVSPAAAPSRDGAGRLSPAAARPATSTATDPQTLPKTPAGFWRDLGLLWSVPILFFIFLANLDGFIDGGTTSRARDTAAVTTVDRTAPDPPTPDPPDDAAPSPPDPPPPPTAADRRQVAFSTETGITDRILARVYEQADGNGDGVLSFGEIQNFQNWVYREFRYQANNTALSPERFGALGGGDCEDFALYTCGLLTYWGYECFVGVFAPPGDAYGQMSHAVALLAVPGPVKTMELVTTDDNPQFPAAARNRTFVPIDYDVVGGFTNATPNPRVLYGIYEATKIYGTWM